MRRYEKLLVNGLIGATALTFAVTTLDDRPDATGPIVAKAVEVVTGEVVSTADPAVISDGKPAEALAVLSAKVRRLSHPEALETAFESYYAYKAANPGAVRKPYLYFVDYGLSSTTERGYVFDMEKLEIVDGPFTVAHGRGSGARVGVPTRFSNKPGSAATSLGLYLAQETYDFSGKASGTFYRSIGLRLKGLSGDWNDNARARGVVAHGAPYVTRGGSGRSEGCPAMEQARAKRLLPMLANGGMVFHFAPVERWLTTDPWVAAANAESDAKADIATRS
jgi:hypothetical protein